MITPIDNGMVKMINEELTFQKFGYYAKDLSLKAGKKIIANCDKCGLLREVYKHACGPFCRKCSVNKRNKGTLYSEESKLKISQSKKGMKYPSLSEEVKKKMSLARKGVNFSKETLLKMSLVKIGKKFSEETKQKLRGENHYNWKGGISPLRKLIYTLQESKTWRRRVFEKDNYTCQKCFIKGGELEVHHIKKFILLLQEFLQHYPQFSPIEDKEILVRLAITWAPFWEVSNGKTLCYNCHILEEKEINAQV